MAALIAWLRTLGFLLGALMFEVMTVEEREEQIADLEGQIRSLDDEFAGQAMPGESREKWNTLNTQLEDQRKVLAELKARQKRVGELARKPENAEPAVPEFQVSIDKRGDIYDLSTIRASVANPEGARDELVDRARVAVERDANFAHPRADQDACASRVLSMLRGDRDLDAGMVAEHVLRTGSKIYRRAFWRSIGGQLLTTQEQSALIGVQRAFAIADPDASAGIVVPYTLDPTILPTSNGTVNPLRQISRVETITGLEWRGATSGAITANRRAESAEMTDNTPTLARPSRRVSRVDVWIPYSFETGQDWGALETEMASLIQDAKDEEEGGSFFTGNGTLPNPQGVLTGTTNTVNATTGQAFDVEDLYRLAGSLPARYRPRGRYLADLLVANLTRQFDTGGGNALWAQLGQDTPPLLLGKPFHEASGMPDSAATGNKFFLFGDFSRFIIVDRIGMLIETVPHVVGTNHIPTGQRGLLAFWRNNAFVADANAFRALIGIA